jgi:hypothetical protein
MQRVSKLNTFFAIISNSSWRRRFEGSFLLGLGSLFGTLLGRLLRSCSIFVLAPMSTDMKTICRRNTGKIVFGRKDILDRGLKKIFGGLQGEGNSGIGSKGGIDNGKSGNRNGIHHGQIGMVGNR